MPENSQYDCHQTVRSLLVRTQNNSDLIERPIRSSFKELKDYKKWKNIANW